MSSPNTSSDHNCCCMHITTCAKIIVILGFISAAMSLVSAIVAWYYLPAGILSLFIYAFVLIGLQKERPDYLLPALTIFGLHILLNLLVVILFIVLGALVAEAEVRIAFFILAGIVLAVDIYNIFAFVVIYRTRNYLIATSQSSRNNVEEAFYPVTLQSQPPPPPPAYTKESAANAA